MCDSELVEPAAAAMIESMRAYGYTVETAIADIIDNSISARCKNVWLTFRWNGNDSYITILDDGHGMNEDELRTAMKPGSRNPLDVRETHDLGRFGLGLKTSSFSQCRRLTVASIKDSNKINVRRWDLDHVSSVDRWELLKAPASGSEEKINPINNIKQGTLVLWEVIDRIVGDSRTNDKRAHDRFLKLIDRVENHLSMVFHRFLDPQKGRLKIFINGTNEEHSVKSWDPFMKTHPASIITPVEPIIIGNDRIYIQGFVLPHKDKLSDDEIKVGGGPDGWNAQQGYYVYRNERLLVPGSWLDLGRAKKWTKDEHYRLARLQLDLPNTLDIHWQIDVKKSMAQPPANIRTRLRELAERVRTQAREIFVHRGSYGPRPAERSIIRIWKEAEREGRRYYRIDRRHALVRELLTLDEPETHIRVEALLKLIEETVPIEKIWLDIAEGDQNPSRPFENLPSKEVEKTLIAVLMALVRQDGLTPEEARERLMKMDGFLDYRSSIVDMKVPKRGEYI